MANSNTRANGDSGIAESEAQMLAKRLADKKGRVEELTGLLRRAEEVMRAYGLDSEHKLLLDDIQDALIEAKREDRSHSVADAAEDGCS